MTPSLPTKRVLWKCWFWAPFSKLQSAINDIFEKRTVALDPLPPSVRCVLSGKIWRFWTTPWRPSPSLWWQVEIGAKNLHYSAGDGCKPLVIDATDRVARYSIKGRYFEIQFWDGFYLCDARLKQEHSEQKKADEKTRRDAIFQQYLQKKAEAAEEGAAPRRQPFPGNRTARLGSRPKSQPPVGLDDKASHSSSHSSQEELCLHGRSPVLDLKRRLSLFYSLDSSSQLWVSFIICHICECILGI